MSEHYPVPETDEQLADIKRRSALSGFAMAALNTPYIASQRAQKFCEETVDFIRNKDEWSNGEVIKNSDRKNVASMRILQQIRRTSITQEPTIVWPEVQEVDDLYAHLDQVLTRTGFDFYQHDGDPNTTIRCSFMYTPKHTPRPDNKYETTVYEVMQERGKVNEVAFRKPRLKFDEQDSLSSLQAPDFMRIDQHGQPKAIYNDTEVKTEEIEVPFYKAYIDERNGAANYLRAFLDDLVLINDRLS